MLRHTKVEDNPIINTKNKIINGDFDIWQRGTMQTSTGYGSDDRWYNANIGSNKIHSQQDLEPKQPKIPPYIQHYSRTIVNSVEGINNMCGKFQKIEDVRTLAGKIATLSFYARTDSPKSIAVSYSQYFGKFGNHSLTLDYDGTKLLLSTIWKKYEVVFNIPSILTKDISNDATDYLELKFWFDAGSNFNMRTDSLGQQSGVFDITNVRLEDNEYAATFERRSIMQEIRLCQRYYGGK